MALKKVTTVDRLLDDEARALILKPISKAEPSGLSCRYEAEYDVIQKARKHEEDLPQGVWKHTRKESQWDEVEETCLTLLKNKTKDLQVCLWLSEAWFHEHQSYGLRVGIDLTHEILLKFWDSFHPYSKDDPEYRVAPLLWFDKELSKSLSQLPVSYANEDPNEIHTFWDYQSRVLVHRGDKTARSDALEKEKEEKSKEFYKRVKATSTEFYLELADNLKRTKAVVVDIEMLIERHYKEFPGCLMHIRSKLEQITHFVEQVCAKRLENERAKAEKERADAARIEVSKQEDLPVDDVQLNLVHAPNASKTAAPSLNGNVPLKDQLQNREQAYAYLEQIAEYLNTIEPHSPTPYLIQKAIGWGDMSLGELMNDLAEQSGDIQNAMNFLGMGSKK